MIIGIMQPYLFPYIGYFQLVKAVDKFIFYDDVNYIKGGWINRNNVLINGNKKYITLHLKNASPNKKINEIYVSGGINKILKTIQQNYSKAPYFKEVFNLIKKELNIKENQELISKVAGSSVLSVSKYLGITTQFEYSSEKYGDTVNFDRTDRIIEICRRNNSGKFINPSGGRELYDKKDFLKKGVKLQFIKNNIPEYKQFDNIFIPYLSIIDVLMFNAPEKINKMLDDYELE